MSHDIIISSVKDQDSVPQNKVEQLVYLYQKSSKVQQLCAAIEQRKSIYVKHMVGSSRAMVIAAAVKETKGKHLVLVNDREEAAYLLNDLERLMVKESVLYYPNSFKRPYEVEEVDNANVLLRAEALEHINRLQDDVLVLVTFPEAIAEKVVNKKTIVKNTIEVQIGEKIDLDFVLDMLVTYGFERVQFVAQPGQFAMRGGIVDVFSFSNEKPYRIELFGDEVDTIRVFDQETQLSIERVKRIAIIPNIQTQMSSEQKESFLEYLGENTVLWIDDIALSADWIEAAYEVAEKAWQNLKDKSGMVLQSAPELLFDDKNVFLKTALAKRLVFMGGTVPASVKAIDFAIKAQLPIQKNFNLLAEIFEKNTKKGLQNLFFSENAKQSQRLQRIFADLKTNVKFIPLGISLHEGFEDVEMKVAVFTDHQLFDRYHKYKLKTQQIKSQNLTLKELQELRKGDFVTHIDHGVGVFDGLEILEFNGKKQEAVRLIYKDNDLLYVGINSLHKIARFTGKEGTMPKLNKLGSDVWAKLKSKTKKQVKELAIDLVKLYAKRKAQRGFAFSPDTYMQTELEASFIYEDTPDQEKSTAAVKQDMERDIPMDRLVCGDVGFGKTEIAIRAAFKAVADSKQVAVLVPTTILALQHYRTFKERLGNFPCNIDYLNRFKSAAKQKLVFEKLKEGKLDIVIGTHGLVGKSVKFKDLGLLIIDEEQKFGVGVKEKLKDIKATVDTLTLTATPIPRTLQFSLMGARDLSVINTPPPNRQPVQTELIAGNEETIRDAVSFELDRGGQVFFIHNRIANINEMAAMISKLCPDARVAAAHGQMEGTELEDILLGFIEGEFDVLVSTNIVESGLDIPNANTMIINQAHMFGLSDLHQMRGRVGRSNTKAFCYLIVPPLSTLTTDARKRLKAIEEFSDLGSGFAISMRDLDIRGAGNLLGGEQSGFISEIGFETYTKILNEAIMELRETEYASLFADQPERATVTDCQIDTDFEALLPTTYVNSVVERLNLYMLLDNIETEEGLERFAHNLLDRFGPIPLATQTLFDIMRLRWLAKALGIEKIIIKKQLFKAYLVSGSNQRFYQSDVFGKILKAVQLQPRKYLLKQTDKTVILTMEMIHSTSEAIDALTQILEQNQQV